MKLDKNILKSIPRFTAHGTKDGLVPLNPHALYLTENAQNPDDHYYYVGGHMEGSQFIELRRKILHFYEKYL